jgi:hypothetical protein
MSWCDDFGKEDETLGFSRSRLSADIGNQKCDGFEKAPRTRLAAFFGVRRTLIYIAMTENRA